LEDLMQKLLTSLAAASVLAFLASAAQADCSGDHNVTASADQGQRAVAMSTHDGALPPPQITEDDDATTEAAATPVCAEGEKDCVPASE
jgi:hypothetical protein